MTDFEKEKIYQLYRIAEQLKMANEIAKISCINASDVSLDVLDKETYISRFSTKASSRTTL